MVGSSRICVLLVWGLATACGDPSGSDSENSQSTSDAPSGGGGPGQSMPEEPMPGGGPGQSSPQGPTPGSGGGPNGPAAGGATGTAGAPGNAGGPGAMPTGPARPSNATRFLPACAEFHEPCSPEVVVDGVTSPLLMRSLSDGLYFRSLDDIVRVTPDGERSVVRTAPGLIYFEIQTDGTLYYATSTPAALHRGALDDPASDEVLVSDSSGQLAFVGFGVTPTDVWQGSDIGLLRLPFDGGVVSPMRDAICMDVVWDGTLVHCRGSSSVLTIDPATLSVTPRDDRNIVFADVELTSRWLYWAPYRDQFVEAPMELSRAAAEPGGDVEVVPLPVHPGTFAPDEGGVYFPAVESIQGYPVYYLADDSVTPVPVVVDTVNDEANGGAGIDATHVYWSQAPQDAPEGGTIWRAPRCGCPP